MTRVFCPAAFPLLLGVALVVACSSTPDAPHGAPVLMNVYWTAEGSRYTIWSSPDAPDPAQVTTVPALGSEIDFVFNRRLDGSRIEDTVTQGGVSVEQSKAIPPITVTGFDPQAVAPPFQLDVLYNSLAVFGGATSYVLAKPRTPGFPSATALTFQLDRSSLTSPYNEPLGMPDTVSIATRDFSVEIRLPTGGDGGAPVVAGSFQLPLGFSNQPSDSGQVLPFIHLRVGGADLPINILADSLNPSLLRVVPGGCLTAWPPSSTIDVTIDPGLPDAFGVGLAAAATASFQTATSLVAANPCGSPDAGSD
jgi:hypothetical protein